MSDLISRQAAIDSIEKCSDDLEKQGQIVLAQGLRASIGVLLTVPNIENGQMWDHTAIWMSTVQGDTVICSQCGFESEEEADFCPNCHAYMGDD